jgi:hypothetical protein
MPRSVQLAGRADKCGHRRTRQATRPERPRLAASVNASRCSATRQFMSLETIILDYPCCDQREHEGGKG